VVRVCIRELVNFASSRVTVKTFSKGRLVFHQKCLPLARGAPQAASPLHPSIPPGASIPPPSPARSTRVDRRDGNVSCTSCEPPPAVQKRDTKRYSPAGPDLTPTQGDTMYMWFTARSKRRVETSKSPEALATGAIPRTESAAFIKEQLFFEWATETYGGRRGEAAVPCLSPSKAMHTLDGGARRLRGDTAIALAYRHVFSGRWTQNAGKRRATFRLPSVQRLVSAMVCGLSQTGAGRQEVTPC
jgi:hypothetical protein